MKSTVLNRDHRTSYRGSWYPPVRVDLSVRVGALRLANPVIAASGTFGYGLEFTDLLDLNRLGGFVTKGISKDPIEGAPPPQTLRNPFGNAQRCGPAKRGSGGIRPGQTSTVAKIQHPRDRERLRLLPGGVCRSHPATRRCGRDIGLRAKYFLPERKKGWDAVWWQS